MKMKRILLFFSLVGIITSYHQSYAIKTVYTKSGTKVRIPSPGTEEKSMKELPQTPEIRGNHTKELREHLETGSGTNLQKTVQNVITIITDNPEDYTKSQIYNLFVALNNRIIAGKPKALRSGDIPIVEKLYKALRKDKTITFKDGVQLTPTNWKNIENAFKKLQQLSTEKQTPVMKDELKKLKKNITHSDTLRESCETLSDILKNRRDEFTRDEVWEVVKALGTHLFPLVGKTPQLSQKQMLAVYEVLLLCQKLSKDATRTFKDGAGFAKAGIYTNRPKDITTWVKKIEDLRKKIQTTPRTGKSAKKLAQEITEQETFLETAQEATDILQNKRLRTQYTRDEFWTVIKEFAEALFPYAGKPSIVITTQEEKDAIVAFFEQCNVFTEKQDGEYLLFGDNKGFYKKGLVNNWPKSIQGWLSKALKIRVKETEIPDTKKPKTPISKEQKERTLAEIKQDIVKPATLAEACTDLQNILDNDEKRGNYKRDAVWSVVKKIGDKVFPYVGSGMKLTTKKQVEALQNLFQSCQDLVDTKKKFGDGGDFHKAGTIINRPKDIKRWVEKSKALKV